MSSGSPISPERFEIEEPLGRGAMGAVYRAYDRERKQRVALKRLLTPDAASIYRFKREFRALANVAHPNLVALYDLISSDDSWSFTMELVHGIDFLTYVRGDGANKLPSSVSRTREIAPLTEDFAAAAASTKTLEERPSEQTQVEVPMRLDPLRKLGLTKPSLALGDLDVLRLEQALPQLVEAIEALHRTGHLHRDIKPTNIMVTDEGRVVVLDFGVITELAGRRRRADDRIAGTPAYMAPELLDGEDPSKASDWYALGIVLYRALTGMQPFAGSSETIFEAKRGHEFPLEPLLECDGPANLIDLCKDLIELDPKGRPTGAEILERLGRKGAKLPVTAAEPGASGYLHLVGREREIEVLREAWRDSREGKGVGVFLRGVSGVGKSALVEAFIQNLEDDASAVVLSGRCYEQESVPYKSVDSLVDSIARYLLSLSNEEIELLLPDDVIALVRAFPVLGRVEAVEAASEGRDTGRGKAELQRRAFAALGELISRIARSTPLALYIDDLQWGDVESAGFLARLVGPYGPPALFIAGYRSEQEETSPLLPALFRAIEAQPESHVRKLNIESLSVPVLESLARELLESLAPGSRSHVTRSRQIAREAKGSPYFVHELVRYTISAPGTDTMAGAATLASVIRARAEQLSPEAQRLLRVISVAGWRMSIGVAQAAAALGPEERRAFVELRAGHFAKSTGTKDTDTIEPYHDRVREMIGASLDPDESRAVHLSIAESLEAASDDSDAEQIYALANHWFLAKPSDKQEHVYWVNLRAGRTAASSFAFHQANTYLTRAEEIATAIGKPLDVDVQILIADARTRIGLTDDAMQRYEEVLQVAKDPMQRAEIRMGLCRIRNSWLESIPAIEEATLALEELGFAPPRNPVLSWLKAIGSLLVNARHVKQARIRGTAVGQELARTRFALALYMQIGVANYFNLTPQNSLRAALQAMRLVPYVGPGRELLDWQTLLFGVASTLRKEKLSQRMSERAKEISDRIDDPVASVRYRLYRGLFGLSTGDSRGGQAAIERTIDEIGNLLEPSDQYTAAAGLTWIYLMRGRSAEGWEVIHRTLQLEAAGGQLNAVSGHTYRCYAGPLLGMLGRIDEGREHMEQRRQEIGHANVETTWHGAQRLAHTILFQVEADDVGEDFDENVRQYLALSLKPKRLSITMRHGPMVIAYGRRRQVQKAQAQDRPAVLEQFKRSLKGLRDSCKGIPLLLAHQAVLEASYFNFIGKEAKARGLLAEAERHARDTENDWVLFEVTMERARYAMDNGKTDSARKRLLRAREYAEEREWRARAERCADLLNQLSAHA